jgi:hypothetical protein
MVTPKHSDTGQVYQGEAFAPRQITSLRPDRAPDFIIGGAERPYMLRWFLLPRNEVFNIYYHRILRDDDDRALL